MVAAPYKQVGTLQEEGWLSAGALVVVGSSHTFMAYVKPEMESPGLNKVQNVWDFYDGDQDEKIQAWFSEEK